MLLKLRMFIGNSNGSETGPVSPENHRIGLAKHAKVKKGFRFRVDSLKEPYSDLAQKLLSMGLVRGTVIEVVNVAPLGDPVQIRTQGYHLSLRLNELYAMNLTAISS